MPPDDGARERRGRSAAGPRPRRRGPASPGAISNVRSTCRGRVRRRRAAARSPPGRSRRLATGRPIPKPGIAALPQASAGSATSVPGRPRLGEVGGDLGVVGDDGVRAAADVRLGRVGEVAERQRPADDRHASPGSSRASRYRRPRPSSAADGPDRRTSPARAHGRAAGRRWRLAVGLGRPPARAGPHGEPGRFVARASRSRLVEPDRRVEPRAAREDPDVPAGIADAGSRSPAPRVVAEVAVAVVAGPSRGSRRTARSGASETRVSSAGSTTPLTRTSPAAIEAIVDVEVSAMRDAVR